MRQRKLIRARSFDDRSKLPQFTARAEKVLNLVVVTLLMVRPSQKNMSGWLLSGAIITGLTAASACGTAKMVTRAKQNQHEGQSLIALDLGHKKPVPSQASPMFSILERELQRNLKRLRAEDQEFPAYFIAHDLHDEEHLEIETRDGAIVRDDIYRNRFLDIDVRVGSHKLDNSHSSEHQYSSTGLGSGLAVSLDDDELSLAQAIWLQTEEQYRDAVDAFRGAQSEESLLTRENQVEHPDFSREKPTVGYFSQERLDLPTIAKRYRQVLVDASSRLAPLDSVHAGQTMLDVELNHQYFVDSEGSRIQQSRAHLRVVLFVEAQAKDGMQLSRTKTFDATRVEDLPDPEKIITVAKSLHDDLVDLRKAPLAEPYSGPAVLEGPAAGVFFHEIFGHRLEGHRQKNDQEGQTFSDMIDRRILPTFLTVVDDPTISTLNGVSLNGYYWADDEGVRAQRTVLVEGGVLKTFLLSRSPVMPFSQSNGHGRRQIGHAVVARQGNLMINSRNTIAESKLRESLIAEVKRQKKPYGLWFSDIEGGFTITERDGPQAFKVIPRMVHRVWADGRPDELVRGADIVGTPLVAFETILATGDEPGIFNGSCGAESGWVPVSAVSPSLLLRQLEIERAVHDRARPPLLPPPGSKSKLMPRTNSTKVSRSESGQESRTVVQSPSADLPKEGVQGSNPTVELNSKVRSES